MTSSIQPCDGGIIQSFKQNYKKLLVEMIIEAYETNGKLKYPDIKEALYLVTQAWSKVSCATINHCWRHVKITIEDEIKLEYKLKHVSDNSNLIINLEQLFESFRFISKCDVLSVKEFVDFENNESTGERLTDEDILDLVLKKRDEENEENDEKELGHMSLVDLAEAKESLSKLFNFFENSLEFDEDDLHHLNCLKFKIQEISNNNKRQSKITDFLNTLKL